MKKLLRGGLILLYCAFFFQCNHQSGKKKIAVVSFISHPIFDLIETELKLELEKQLGDSYVLIESNAQGKIESLPEIAREIIRQKPDVIVPISTPVTQAFLRLSEDDIKIVYTFVSDTLNLMDALLKANITGLSDVINYRANLELIDKLYSTNVVIGIAYNPNEANSVKGVNELNLLVQSFPSLKLKFATVTNESEIPLISSQLLRDADLVLSIGDNTVGSGLKVIIDEAFKVNKAVFAIDEESIRELGAVGGVSVDYRLLGIETAKMIAKVVREGKQPREIRKVMLPGDKVILNETSLERLKINIPGNIKSQVTLLR